MPEDAALSNQAKRHQDWFARLIGGLGLLVAMTNVGFNIWSYYATRETRLALRCDPVLGEPIEESGTVFDVVVVPFLAHCRLTNSGAAVIYVSSISVSSTTAGEGVKGGILIGNTGGDTIKDRVRQILEFDTLTKSLRERGLPVRLDAGGELDFYVKSEAFFGPEVIKNFALSEECGRRLRLRKAVRDVLEACLGGMPLGDYGSPFAASEPTRYRLGTIVEIKTSTGVSVRDTGATILIRR